MALIVCPNCCKQVSDKAESCPGCGYRLVEETVTETISFVCEECGTELLSDTETCPECGYPISEQAEKNAEAVPQEDETSAKNRPFADNTKEGVIITVVILIILAIIIGLVAGNSKEEKKNTIYSANLHVVKSTMLEGATEAESAGNLIRAVWYNTIYEKRDATTDKYTRSKYYNITKNFFNSDFNDSLTALFSDSDFVSQISTIQNNQETVINLMKDLQNPPEEYAEAYETVEEMYDAYLELTNLVINPTGSLQTYSASLNDASSEVLRCYNKLKIYAS